MRTLLAVTALFSGQLAMAQDPSAHATPTPAHERLYQNLGKRTGTMKMWMNGPDAPAIDIPFTTTERKILGGLWVESDYQSGPYQGRGLVGYDPDKKKYVGVWTNNMAPYMSIMEGEYDEETHSLTMVFKDFDIMAGKMVDMKSVTTAAPGQPETFTMYKKENGKWVKSFVMNYDK